MNSRTGAGNATPPLQHPELDQLVGRGEPAVDFPVLLPQPRLALGQLTRLQQTRLQPEPSCEDRQGSQQRVMRERNHRVPITFVRNTQSCIDESSHQPFLNRILCNFRERSVATAGTPRIINAHQAAEHARHCALQLWVVAVQNGFGRFRDAARQATQ